MTRPAPKETPRVRHPADRQPRREPRSGSFAILGPKNNLPFFAELLDYPEFVTGRYDTGIVGRMRG